MPRSVRRWPAAGRNRRPRWGHRIAVATDDPAAMPRAPALPPRRPNTDQVDRPPRKMLLVSDDLIGDLPRLGSIVIEVAEVGHQHMGRPSNRRVLWRLRVGILQPGYDPISTGCSPQMPGRRWCSRVKPFGRSDTGSPGDCCEAVSCHKAPDQPRHGAQPADSPARRESPPSDHNVVGPLDGHVVVMGLQCL